MKKFHYSLYFTLGMVMILVLGISSLHNTQTELGLLCDKFNEDITLPDGQECIEPVTMSKHVFTFINRRGDIAIYEYIRMDPTRRIQPLTRVWFMYAAFRPTTLCEIPTTFDRWRMPIWMTPEEKACFNLAL